MLGKRPFLITEWLLNLVVVMLLSNINCQMGQDRVQVSNVI